MAATSFLVRLACPATLAAAQISTSAATAPQSAFAPLVVSSRQARRAADRWHRFEAAAADEGAADVAVVAEVEAEEEVEYVGNDELVMYFKAEGSLTESAISKVTKALEAVEGVHNVKVTVLEGCATVELTKVTTVQETGVASGLVEVIQGAGFAMQTLSLAFDEDVAAETEFFNAFRMNLPETAPMPEPVAAE
eukprot:TRINITY_DN70035_c0_g2_i1.p1 TRINITY_DN70035_c0_g2~~TRINITY_DN70035_c0_g2_i1.p1  ORF type:complete len:194 (-),score=27.42 TRINITY_DN70035_c0_g2_i1:169-750(-)